MSGSDGLSIKRLSKEFSNMQNKLSYDYYAEPVKGEMFEWHFTIRGPPSTDYEGGIYHGLIQFPENYPFKPPSIQFLTPNGRFETNTKICLTFTNFHPEYWQPAWTVRTIMIGLISYMPIEEDALSIGSIITTPNERKKLARASQHWSCTTCGLIREFISDKMSEENKKNDDAEVKKNLPEFCINAKKDTKKSKEENKGDKNEDGDQSDQSRSQDDQDQDHTKTQDKSKPQNEGEGADKEESPDSESDADIEQAEEDKNPADSDEKNLDIESDTEKADRLEREQKIKAELRQIVESKRDKELSIIFYVCVILLACWSLYGVIIMGL